MRDLIARLRGHLFILTSRIFRRNIAVGAGLSIYKGFRIFGNGVVRIGKNCSIDGICGDSSQYVCLDTHAPDAVITIGDNARLYAARIVARYQVTIGNDVLIEEAGIVDTDFHSIKRSRENPAHENRSACGITIGSRVSIGARSYITKGVTIGDNVVIAPGSIVTNSIQSGSLAFGNPARRQATLYRNDGLSESTSTGVWAEADPEQEAHKRLNH
jgi:acetyltransferase-like isoleucine patch superfamily enzyme